MSRSDKKTHIVIPDTQVSPSFDTKYLRAIGNYIVRKQPDRVIHLGDFSDMESLCSYDRGSRGFEGRRYSKDIRNAHEAQDNLLSPIWRFQDAQRKLKKKVYKPDMHMTLGNHENRIDRATEKEPMLDGTISISDLKFEQYGWNVHPFLDVVTLDGIAYSHYLTSGIMGRPISSAAAILSKRHQSAIVGHQPGLQIASSRRADGRMLTAIIAGSAYPNALPYLGPQENIHWRGILILHEVQDGEFTFIPVSLDYLMKNYYRK